MSNSLAVSYTAPPPVWAVLHTAATASVRPHFDVVDHPVLYGIHVFSLALAARGSECDATLKDTGYISYLIAG